MTSDLPKTIGLIPAAEAASFRGRLEAMGFACKRETAGMVMINVQDCFDTPFHLGEAIACEALVAYRDRFGYAIPIGDNRDGAFILACRDAAEQTGDTGVVRLIHEWLEPYLAIYREQVADEMAMVASTKVNFGLMVEG